MHVAQGCTTSLLVLVGPHDLRQRLIQRKAKRPYQVREQNGPNCGRNLAEVSISEKVMVAYEVGHQVCQLLCGATPSSSTM